MSQQDIWELDLHWASREVPCSASGDSSTLVFASTTSSVDSNKVVDMLTCGSPQTQGSPTQQQRP